MMVCKAYDETTAADFRQLFVDRFPTGDAGLLDVVLKNPGRSMRSASGSIAYGPDGTVLGMFGLLPRRIYFGQHDLHQATAFAMAVKKDADRSFFTDFLRDSICETGADVFFANTTIPGSRKRLQAAVSVVDGPESCAEIRERALRSNGLFARVMRKVGAKFRRSTAGSSSQPYQAGFGRARSMIAPDSPSDYNLILCHENAIVDADFNVFWESYLKTNTGLVSSRTAEELRWVFGSGLASGEVVLITARKEGALCGYAFCRRTDEMASCWRVVDLIALENDEKILESLIEGASQFLRQCTPALYLQITGYPTWVQSLLKRLFPKSSSFGFNKCIWVALNEKAKALCSDWVNAPNGWYGSPYDGDMCLM